MKKLILAVLVLTAACSKAPTEPDSSNVRIRQQSYFKQIMFEVFPETKVIASNVYKADDMQIKFDLDLQSDYIDEVKEITLSYEHVPTDSAATQLFRAWFQSNETRAQEEHNLKTLPKVLYSKPTPESTYQLYDAVLERNVSVGLSAGWTQDELYFRIEMR
jgi:hypothetical protein